MATRATEPAVFPHPRKVAPLRVSIACLTVVALLTACGDSAKDTTPKGSGGIDVTGAGATFPYPVYSRWISRYAAATGVRINYQSIGSGGGIRQLAERTVDFGATEIPLDSTEIKSGESVFQIPMVVGAVVVTYNVPEIAEPLQFDGNLLADIFLGRVTHWNDSRIAALNSGVRLPARDILVVHRTDGSGTTYIYTSFLSAENPRWKSGPGAGAFVRFPVGLGAKGNEGVAGQVKATEGAIGYIELAYAITNRLPTSSIRNTAGVFTRPTEAALMAAATSGSATPSQASLLGAPDSAAYPMAAFSWILVHGNGVDSTRVAHLVGFLRWALQNGDADAALLGYAPLPRTLRPRVDSLLKQLERHGR